jgi:hypothetical protein
VPALAIWSPDDGVLGAVAPLGLAAAAGTALVVDLDPDGPRYPGEASLAQLVADGPRRSDLEPERSGVAVLGNGGIEPEAAEEVLTALTQGWPAVVFRLPSHHRGGDGAIPIVPLLPGTLFAGSSAPAVYQRSGWRVDPPGPGVVLPRPRRSTLGALLTGVVPGGKDPWIRAFGAVWERRWA